MREWYTRANCSPSWVLLGAVIVLGLIINIERKAAEEAAVWTLGVLGSASLAVGLFMITRTVRGWHAQPATEVQEAPAVAEDPETAAPMTLAEEADALAADTGELAVAPDGTIVKV